MAVVEFSASLVIPVDPGEAVFVDVVSDELEAPLLQHWPPGRWALAPESVLRRLLRAAGRVLSRPRSFVRTATRQLDPGQAEAELGRWEQLLGLPSTGELALRRAAAQARLRARGGQSAKYFRELLEGLGYVQVEVFGAYDPLRCEDRCEKRVQDEAWAFTLIVRAPSLGELDEQAEALVRAGVRGSVVVVFEWL